MDRRNLIRADSTFVTELDKEEAVVRQMEFYLGKSNLPTDYFLLQQMSPDYWIKLDVLAKFPKMLRFSMSVEEIGEVLVNRSKEIEVDAVKLCVRPVYMVNEKRRSVLILRDVAETVTEEKIRALIEEVDYHPPTSVRPDIANVWFIDFDLEEDARQCLEKLQGKSLDGSPVLARIKTVVGSLLDPQRELKPVVQQPFVLHSSKSAAPDFFNPQGMYKGKGRKTANGFTRRGRRRSITKQKEEAGNSHEVGPGDAELVPVAVNEEVMKSGKHFPPLKNGVEAGTVLSNNGESNSSNPPASFSESHSDQDESLSLASASPSLESAKQVVCESESKEKELSSSIPEQTSPSEDSVASVPSPQLSYAAILRMKSAKKSTEAPNKSEPSAVMGSRTGNREQSGKVMATKASSKAKSRPQKQTERESSSADSKKLDQNGSTDKKAVPGQGNAAPSREMVPPSKPSVGQSSAFVWQNKPSTVLEAPTARCVEKHDEGGMQVDSTPQLIRG